MKILVTPEKIPSMSPEELNAYYKKYHWDADTIKRHEQEMERLDEPINSEDWIKFVDDHIECKICGAKVDCGIISVSSHWAECQGKEKMGELFKRFDAVLEYYRGYTIGWDIRANRYFIQCLTCGMKSYNENDIKYKYCGKCHKFH